MFPEVRSALCRCRGFQRGKPRVAAIDVIVLLLFGLLSPAASLSGNVERADNGQSISETLEREFSGAFANKPPSSGNIRTVELIAAEQEWGIVPPYRTAVWAYNGTVPGPVIRMQLGETLRVRLTNRLAESTTVHWHGVRVPNAMDGVPDVTQEPVQPGKTFTYEFSPKDAGTFWFHPHLNAPEQIERGLYGVLIVEDPKEPVYSQDLVWVLDDWLFGENAQIYPQFVTRHDLAHDGRWGNVLTVNGSYRPAFPMQAGERIRIRLINAANGRVFAPSFDTLSPQVIAVDGLLVAKPFPLGKFFLAPGNRLDLDVTIPKSSAGQSFALIDQFSGRATSLASLEVGTGPAVDTPDFAPPGAEHFPAWDQA
ncbi:MAG: multicopper oxidase family protein, partial [Gammaproteobacteria bacterium]